ncbi:MAG: nascent polypeptide-associated complex protein [Candidatus Saliniplasma sp.]
MMPGGLGNSRQMKRMMKKMGMESKDIDAEKVIIETSDKKLVFDNAEVVQMKVKGQEMYQIVGSPREEAVEGKVLIDEEDIKLVSERAGVSQEEAKKALEETEGKPAEAIIKLTT